MTTEPDPDPRLAEATRLTDALDDPDVLEVAAGSFEAGVRETLRLQPAGPIDGPGARQLRVLAGIGLAFRLAYTPSDPRPADEPHGLFRWGPLTVRRAIGEGQFGEVYAAWDPRLEREVALKLRRSQAGTLRWLDEARSLARVQHPHVVTVHGADLADGRAGIWMELVRGETLEDFLTRSGRLETRACLRIGRDLASALAAVHRAGLVHGDLKASNVMIATSDEPEVVAGANEVRTEPKSDRKPQAKGASPEESARVVLMDFGAASRLAAGPGQGPRFGTPLSTAPEVLNGEPATAASDVYSLGVLLYRMLTGGYPVEAPTLDELRAALEARRRVPVGEARAGLPARVARVVESSLASDPQQRPASAAHFRDELARLLGERVTRIPPALVAGGLASLAAALAIGWLLWQQLVMRDENVRRVPPPVRLAISRVPAWTTGTDPRHRDLGWQFALGDLDRDGRQDLVLADPGYSDSLAEQGAVEWYRGTPHGLTTEPAWHTVGTVTGERRGWSVDAGGDLDGDGYADVVTSDCLRRDDRGRAFGHVRIYHGGPSGPGPAPPRLLPAELQVASFVTITRAVGDVNGDGFQDLLATEQNWNGEHRNQGRVRIYRGGPQGLGEQETWSLLGDPQSSAFGTFVVPLGDVNGDHLADLVIGAGFWHDGRGETGAAHVLFGSAAGPVRAPHGLVTGDRGGDLLGVHRSLEAIGDADRGGVPDLAVGIVGHDGLGKEVGEVRIYRGTRDGLAPHPIWRAQGYSSNGQLGCSIAGGADVDGDGIHDLLVGCYGFALTAEKAGAGGIFLYRGTGDARAFERTPAWWVAWEQPESLFGAAVGLADLDGDGHADLIAGAPRWRDGPTQIGRVVVYRGAGPAR